MSITGELINLNSNKKLMNYNYNEMNPTKRIIFNTSILYLKLIVSMILGLYTTRLVLEALGEVDFGIYSLVAGVVAILGIVNSSMTNASMRYIAHSLGSGNEIEIRKTFNTTLLMHFIIGIAVILLIEAGGWLMFKYYLNIPISKIASAKVVFHLMTVTTFISIISVPYDAVMTAHENIRILSVVDLLGYIIKLGISIYLINSKGNLLVIYSILIMITQLLLRIIKQLYSKIYYSECKINFKKDFDAQLSRKILAFSGWNLFGSIASMAVTQVRGIILNIFFGVSLNAADGLSKTASAQVNLISISMTQALNPQLVKSEGRGDRERMLHLTILSTKYSLFLFAIIAIPVIFEANYLLHFWLKDVPSYAVIFCQLILLGLLIEKMSFEITTAIRAIGNIRNLTVVEAFISILNIPISYFAFHNGYPPFTIFFIYIFLSVIAFVSRLYFGKTLAGLDIRRYLQNAIMPIILPFCIVLFFLILIHLSMKENLLRLAIIFISSTFLWIITFWFLALSNFERKKFNSMGISFLKHLKATCIGN